MLSSTAMKQTQQRTRQRQRVVISGKDNAGKPADSSSIAVGMIGGAALGASFAGPAGAIIGGIIGSLLVIEIPPK